MSTGCAVHFEAPSVTTCKRCQRPCCEPCLGGVDLCVDCTQREVNTVPPLGGLATLAAAGLLIPSFTLLGTVVLAAIPSGHAELPLGIGFVLTLLLSVVTGVCLAMFTFRAARHALARQIDFDAETPFSAAVSWFIPILNLVRPFTLLRQMKLSTRQSTAGVDAWQGLWVAGLVMINAPTLTGFTRFYGEVLISVAFVLLGSAGIVGAFVIRSLRRW